MNFLIKKKIILNNKIKLTQFLQNKYYLIKSVHRKNILSRRKQIIVLLKTWDLCGVSLVYKAFFMWIYAKDIVSYENTTVFDYNMDFNKTFCKLKKEIIDTKQRAKSKGLLNC